MCASPLLNLQRGVLEIGCDGGRNEFVEPLAKPFFEMALGLRGDGFDLQSDATPVVGPTNGRLTGDLSAAFGEAELHEYWWMAGYGGVALNGDPAFAEINDLYLLSRRFGKSEDGGQ